VNEKLAQAVIDAARDFAITGNGFDVMCRALEAYETGDDRCPICAATEPHTGTCGSDDPRALCKRAASHVALTRTYTTQPGESVAGIALRQCGDEKAWRHILACNPTFSDLLPHEYFPVGTVLMLPPLVRKVHEPHPAVGELSRERDELKAELKRREERDKGNVWFWQGDGNDHLESLTCQVVIHADDLRAMLADRAAVIQALQKALAYWMPKVFDGRSAHDAYLLVGYEGETEESWGEKVQAELERLNAIINTPHTDDFLKSVSIEAEHQRRRWDDSGKTPADWFWLVGYLAGKALNALIAGDQDKAKHHVITTAAALANWHLVLRGDDAATTVKPEPRTTGEAVFRMGDDGVCRVVTGQRAPYEWRDTGALETGEGHA
jgi:hypothetical protein